MNVLETNRLSLRWFNEADAPYILEQLNDPGWVKFIGDRGVRTLGDARDYLVKGPIAMYAREGFGLYLVTRKEDGASIGMCGLIRRPGLEDVDIGFAFLPQYNGQGYAYEAAAAVLKLGQEKFALKRIVAITVAENAHSIRLLEKIGLAFEKTFRMPKDDEELRLYVIERG